MTQFDPVDVSADNTNELPLESRMAVRHKKQGSLLVGAALLLGALGLGAIGYNSVVVHESDVKPVHAIGKSPAKTTTLSKHLELMPSIHSAVSPLTKTIPDYSSPITGQVPNYSKSATSTSLIYSSVISPTSNKPSANTTLLEMPPFPPLPKLAPEIGDMIESSCGAFVNGKYKEAGVLLDKVMLLVKDKNWLEFLGYMRGTVALRSDDYDLAIKYLGNPTKKMREFLGEGMFLVGISYQKVGKHDLAVAELKQSSLPIAKWGLAQSYLALGKGDEAAKIYSGLIDSKEDQISGIPGILVGRAFAYANAGKSDLAFNDLKKAFEQRKDALAEYSEGAAFFHELTPEIATRVGLKSINRDKFDDALAWFDRSIRLNKNYAPAYAGRALANLYSNHPDQAKADLDAALKIDKRALETILEIFD